MHPILMEDSNQELLEAAVILQEVKFRGTDRFAYKQNMHVHCEQGLNPTKYSRSRTEFSD